MANWRTAALCGALAWLAYGVLETLAFALLPAWTLAPIQYVPLHSGWLCVLFVSYAATGAILTTALHCIVAVEFRQPRWLATTGLLLVWFVAVISTGADEEATLPGVVSLEVVAGLLLVTTVLATRRPRWSQDRLWLVAPWPVAAALVTASFIARQEALWPWGATFILGCFMALGWEFWRSRARPPGGLRITGTVTTALLALALALNIHANGAEDEIRDDPQSTTEAAPGLPNVLLVVMDTVRADHLSLYGYPRDTTPFLEELARDSRVYRRATATAGMTLASHGSMFTGLYPSRHHAHPDTRFDAGRPLAKRYETLAERLSAAGYDTAGVVANTPYLTKYFGLDQGFNFYDAREPGPLVTSGAPHTLRALAASLARGLLPPVTYDIEFRPGDAITDSALNWLNKRQSARPFFLFVNYMDAHWPTLPPPPYRDRYPGRIPGYSTADFETLEYDVLTLARSVGRGERNHAISQYDGALAYIDSQVRALVEALDSRGLKDDTLLLVVSDHGEAFGEKDLITHGTSLYENLVHVPLITRWPGHITPGWWEDRVSLVDLFPTILHAAGLSAPAGIDGDELLEREDRTSEPTFHIAESYPDGTYRKWSQRFRRNLRAVFRGDMKWIRSSRGKNEQFDLGEDPNEEHPLAGPVPEDMRSFHEEWLRHASEDSRIKPEEAQEEMNDILKSLGYVR